MYLLVEKASREKTINIVLARVGFVAGGAQVVSGFGACVATLGVACSGYGVPMILHGANNLYENGYYLLYRKNKSGAVRDAYQYAATKLGYSDREANLVYGTVDLSLAGYGSFRKIILPREKSWSLFRNIKSDYIRGWQDASKVVLGLDGLSSTGTGWQMYTLTGENK